MSNPSAHKLAILFDAEGEDWPSMELCGEMLLRELRAGWQERFDPEPVHPVLPRAFRRLGFLPARKALNADRAVGRYLQYPVRLLYTPRRETLFHLVDHSYAHLVHTLPSERTGVFCHDLDLFRCLLEPEDAQPRSTAFRALAWTVLRGLQRAALVFHTTRAVRDEILRHGLVDPARLVQAPLAPAPEFHPGGDLADASAKVLDPLGGHPFLLHVGNDLPRKRLDRLFELFAELHARIPELRLVQLGGPLSPEREEDIQRLGIGPALLRPPRLSRSTLAGLYRKAAAVVITSDAEGFGIPVLEALACGCPVVASDLPSLREVGGDAVLYCPPDELSAWTHAVEEVLQGRRPDRHRRAEQAARFTWAAHARAIAEAYAPLTA